MKKFTKTLIILTISYLCLLFFNGVGGEDYAFISDNI